MEPERTETVESPAQEPVNGWMRAINDWNKLTPEERQAHNYATIAELVMAKREVEKARDALAAKLRRVLAENEELRTRLSEWSCMT